jgi:hypothetical protein
MEAIHLPGEFLQSFRKKIFQLWYNDIREEVSMSKINAIRKAIETLSEDEYVELRQWFSERDWKKWDQEIEKDSKAGKLDFLVREAFDQKRQGNLKDL